MNKYFLLLFSIFFVSGIFASGLEIVGDDNFDMNKTDGISQNLIFTLKNTEAFAFYNITLESNSDISFPKIDALEPNQNVNITATVNSNSMLNKDFKIKGFYSANIGQSNDNYDLNVNFNTGVDLCQLTVISGDTMTFKNNVNSDIRMINTQTSQEMTTILENSTYTMNTIQQEYIYYHFLRAGYQFTQGCFLNILGTDGYVNNPEFDANLHLNLNILYEPTTVGVTILDNNYTMDFYATQEGLLQIENTGTNIAKGIHLQSDWFSFSSNDFDISPGYTKTVSYEISPDIFSTNDTDRYHIKELAISGNFDTIYENFSIFINYNDIDTGNFTSRQSIGEIIAEYCIANPDIPFCKEEVKIIIKNQSDNDFNVSYSQQQVNDMFEMIFNVMDDIEATNAYLREEINNIYSTNNNSASNIIGIRNSVDNLKEDKDSSSTVVSFIIIMILFIMICVGAVYIIVEKRKKNKIEKIRTMK